METTPGGGRTAPGWVAALATLAAAACVLGLGAVQGADAMVGAALVSLLLVAVALLVVNSKAQVALLSSPRSWWPRPHRLAHPGQGIRHQRAARIPVAGVSRRDHGGRVRMDFGGIPRPRPTAFRARPARRADRALGIGAISIAVNACPIVAHGTRGEFAKSVAQLAGFVFVFVMVGSLLKAERDIRAVAQVLVLAGSVVALAALYEFYTGSMPFTI